MQALKNVGDQRRGMWEESSDKAYHVRIRLMVGEEMVTGPAIDVRGTADFERRLSAVRRVYPWAPAQ